MSTGRSMRFLASGRRGPIVVMALLTAVVVVGTIFGLMTTVILSSEHRPLGVPPPADKFRSRNTAVCTIASRNYIGRVRTFFSSLYAHQPNITTFLLLVDRNEGYIQERSETFILVELEQLRVPEANDMLLRYTQMEANTAFKAALLLYITKTLGFQKVAYFDPDIWITASIEPMWALLDYYSVLLTPHIVEPYPVDKYHPNDLDILRAGTLNLGFIALRSTPQTMSFLEWWHRVMIDGAYVDLDRGYHFDQKWTDFVPSFVSDAFVLREKVYNVAYWNLHERGSRIKVDEYGVCCVFKRDDNIEERVVFFHFSGLELDDVDSISKHSQRFRLARDFPNLRAPYETYAQLYRSMIPAGSLSVPYAYDFAPDGTPMHNILRQLFRELSATRPQSVDPFTEIVTVSRQYVNPHTTVTKFLYKLWRMRNDLQGMFPDPLSRDALRFRKWFEQIGRRETKVSEKTFPRDQLA